MKDRKMSREELADELHHVRQRVAELEAWKARHEGILTTASQCGAQFKNIAENSMVGVYLIQDGMFKYVNPKLAQMFGYSVEELLNLPDIMSLVFPDDRPTVMEKLRERISGEVASVNYQSRGIKKSGEVIHVQVYGSRMDYNGSSAIMGTLLDITGRLKSEALLEKELNKFQALYDLAVAMTANRDLDENLSLVVEKSRELLGVESSYIALRDEEAAEVYMHVLSGIRTEEFKKMRLPFGAGLGGRVAATGRGFIVRNYFAEIESPEHDAVRAEGLISGIAVPIRIDQTNLGVLYGFTRTETSFSRSDLDTLLLLGNLAAVEISRRRQEGHLQKARQDLEQKVEERTAELFAANEQLKREIAVREKAECSLRRSESMLRNILSTSPVGIGLAEGRTMKWANEAWMSMFGFEDEREFVGKGAATLYPSEAEFERTGGILYEGLRTGKVTSTDATFKRKDGSLFSGHIRMMALTPESVEKGTIAVISDISDRKAAEEALRESEERYRAVFNNAAVGIALTDTQGRWLQVNSVFAEMFGRTGAELRGLTNLDLTYHEDLEISRERLRALVQGDIDSYRYHKRFVRKDGRAFWTDVAVSAVRGSDGSCLGTVGVLVDITQSKETQMALQGSQQRLELALEGADLGLWDWNIQAGEIFYNQRWAEMMGMPAADSKTSLSAWRQRVHPEDASLIADALNSHLTGAIPHYEVEYRFRNQEGGWKWIHARGKVVERDKEGKPLRMTGTSLDITGRRKAETVQRRLAAAVEQVMEGIVITDSEGEIQYVNPAFERMTGYARDEVLGLNASEFWGADHNEEFFAELRATLARGEVWRGRLTERKKDGTVYQEDTTISPVFDDFGEIVNHVGVKRDMTEQLALEKQLLHAQKMEAVGTLAGGIAHDFNNLLTVVSGYTELLLMERSQDDPEYSDLRKIAGASQRGAELVRNLLAFSRKVETLPRPVNLNHSVDQMRKLLHRTIPKMIEIELNLAQDLRIVNADPVQIEQVLINLAVNAKDAMPDGGKLVIETANVTLDPDDCKTHFVAHSGDYVLITVSDTGHGMDNETLEHVFEPFYTTKGPGQGTGLGLSMVYGIVQQHDGHVTCYSEPGIGTTFNIYIPAVETESEKDVAPTTEMPVFGTETILLVDDEESVRDLGVRILSRLGYSVITADNGKEALDMYRSNRGKISLVILDLIMPEMGGSQCLQELLKMDPNVKVVIASGFSLEGPAKKIIHVGAKDLMSKPYKANRMLKLVRRVLDSD